MTLAIEARGVTRRFGPWIALQPTDLAVEEGALLVLLGPNGAGKTTLLRLLAGLSRPSGGSLRVGSHGRDRRARRAAVGLVAHATFLYPALSARENLELAGRLFGVPRPSERADELLARLELCGAADRRVGTFSRGMGQRLAVARALVHEPRVLLLDEPFAGLDARAVEIVEALLRSLHAEGRTLVLAEHDLPRAARLATRGLLLRRGCAEPIPPPALRDPEALAAHYRRCTEDARP